MYHIIKMSRLYTGNPYSGPSSDGIPLEFKDLADAQKRVLELNITNPVGWDIYDSETGLLVNTEVQKDKE